MSTLDDASDRDLQLLARVARDQADKAVTAAVRAADQLATFLRAATARRLGVATDAIEVDQDENVRAAEALHIDLATQARNLARIEAVTW